MATRQGVIKKTPIEQFEKVRSSGIRALTVKEGDELAWVEVTSGSDEILLTTALGKVARFPESEVRPMGRDAAGVIGIRLARVGDEVVGMHVARPGADVLVLTETGYGKRVEIVGLRRTHRTAQGVRLIALDPERTGRVAATEVVTEEDEELLLISENGQVVRTDVTSVNRYGTNARGVIVMRLNEGDRVAGIAVFRAGLAEQQGIGDNDAPTAPGGDGSPPGAAG
jgi:DNA gyrase subunit A